jgi:hypothetical protein
LNLHQAATVFAAALGQLARAGYAVYWAEDDERYRVHVAADEHALEYFEVGNPHGHWDVTCGSPLAHKVTTDVTVPKEAFDALVTVAAHVSAGHGAAHLPGQPYPDATARRALGALDDAGLLPKDNGRD